MTTKKTITMTTAAFIFAFSLSVVALSTAISNGVPLASLSLETVSTK